MALKKDGRYLNCYIERTLLDDFELVCEVQHKTKTKVLENAMRGVINDFISGPSVKDGVYLKEGIDCKVVGTVDLIGEPYLVIFYNGELHRVPATDVAVK